MTTQEKAQEIKDEIEKQTNAALAKYSKEDVAQLIDKQIKERVYESVLSYLGIQADTWSYKLTLKTTSPLYHTLEKTAQEAIEGLRQELNKPVALSPKERKTIENEYIRCYKAQLKELAQKEGKKRAYAMLEIMKECFQEETDGE